jgi:Ricin-type beta-trefoil lectin domain-like
MTPRMGQQEIDGLLTIRNAWMEGKAPMPSDPVSVFETNINNLLALFLGKGTSVLLGPERSASQPVTIINKLSGKALEVENASIDQAARILQVTRNGVPNQRWFIKRAKFSKQMVIPAVIFREMHRYSPSFFRFPLPVYSLIAAHSGLCLDILKDSTKNSDALQQSPLIGRSSHLWAFAPDQKGYNFIVNLCSGRVLDVADSSLKNYATVQQYPFNGGDSQRWQLFSYS